MTAEAAALLASQYLPAATEDTSATSTERLYSAWQIPIASTLSQGLVSMVPEPVLCKEGSPIISNTAPAPVPPLPGGEIPPP